jgi:hypothetical protein
MRWSEIATVAAIALLAAFWLAQAASIPGTVVSSKITTGNTDNTFGVADTTELIGGAMQVTYSAERNAIPTDRRKDGMLVWVKNNRQYYQLYSGSWRVWRQGGDSFVVGTTAPADTTVLWINISDPTAITMNVYYNGSWLTIAGGGVVLSEFFTFDEGTTIQFDDGSTITLN